MAVNITDSEGARHLEKAKGQIGEICSANPGINTGELAGTLKGQGLFEGAIRSAIWDSLENGEVRIVSPGNKLFLVEREDVAA